MLKVWSKSAGVSFARCVKAAAVGVGEEHVRPAPAFSDGVEDAGQVVEVGDVATDRGGLCAEGLSGLVELSLSSAGDEDVSALIDEAPCGGQTDPG